VFTVDHMSFPQTHGSGLHTHFVTRLHLRFTLSHTLPQHSTSPVSLNLKDMVSFPKRDLLGCFLRINQTLLLSPEEGLNLNAGSYHSDEWGSQIGSSTFQGPLDQHGLVAPDMGSPHGGPGTLSR
jgi:hypothetical protein